MVRVGLTGGIASGKTLVGDELGALGACVIDADVLAREVVGVGTAALVAIRERFGPDVVRDDGTLDRGRLADIIFGDAQARADLNAIVHPRVRALARAREEQCPEAAVVVHVIPLLVETGQADAFDAVLVVDVPPEVQVSRLMARNALTRRQARDRVEAQAPREDRLAAAHWVIDNSGDPELTRRRVREVWEGPLAELAAQCARG